MAQDRAALLELLRAAPDRTAILLDFDGTLAPIVDDPARAVPLAGAGECLASLTDRYRRVAVISGRPARYLMDHLPVVVTLVGLYGLEEVRDGAVIAHPEAVRWRPVVDQVVALAEQQLPSGVGVEHKGLSLTLHVRRDPALAAIVETWASVTAAASGLDLRRARMSAELHPPIAADKGTAVTAMLADVDVACFIGDDVGDVPAFDALDAFERRGGAAARVVVESSELDPALRARADSLLAGPTAVMELLQALAI